MIFQTYGVSSHHDGHSCVCSMGLWFLLRTVCCNCCKRSDTQHSLLCSLCSVSVLQWPQKMTSQCQLRLSFCSIDIFFCHRELTNQLHHRGYLKQDIASAIDKARQRSRDDLLSYRPKSVEVGTILPFVLTYHPDLPKVRDIVDKNWSIIESSDELKDIYQSKPVMAFRRPKSLRDFLVRARLKPNSNDDNQNGECRPCGRKRCQCCKMITSAGTVKSSSGATVRLRQNTDCTTENVVYLISCSSCNKQYVGETKGPLNKRMNGHRDDWRHRRFERSPTAEHFHSADHDFLSHASVCCLEHNKEWSDSTRKLRESYWIRRLNTLCPFGINKGD